MRFLLRFSFVVVPILGLGLTGFAGIDRNYINQLSSRVATVDRELVADNEHGYSLEEVVKALRELDAEYTATHSRILIRLRDEPTIEKYVSRFIESEATDGRAGGVLAGSYSPWVIPLIIDYLDAREIEYTQHPNPEVAGFWGFSGNTAIIIRGILRRSEEFPAETRAWAEGLPNYGEEPLRKLRDTLTVWWEENEAHFENEDYHLVRPVSWDLQEDIEEEDYERDDDLGESESPGDEIPETEEPTPEPDSGTREVREEEQDRTIWLWGIAGIVALVLVAFGAFNLRSRGKSA